jgi:hypothetical protein
MLSYAHGVGEEPLLGETIGANLERTIARSSSTRRPGTRWASEGLSLPRPSIVTATAAQ